MKHISRMIIFSALSIYVTELWNRGFHAPSDILNYLKAAAIIAIIYYLVTPLSKLLLLPLNILTMGLISVLAYFIVFYLVFHAIPIITIKPWISPSFSYNGITVSPYHIGYWQNVALSAISVSSVINVLELVL